MHAITVPQDPVALRESTRELAQWVEYCNFGGASTLAQERAQNGHTEPFGVRFWGIGSQNEVRGALASAT